MNYDKVLWFYSIFHLLPMKLSKGEPQPPALVDNFVHVVIVSPGQREVSFTLKMK